MAVVFKAQQKPDRTSALDRVGICVSAACIVQCMVLPLLVIVTPLVSVGFLAEDAFHLMLLAVILPVSVLAFGLGLRVHRDARVLLPGLAGLALVITAVVLERTVLGTVGAALLTSLGGALLIAGHWLNLRQRRRTCLRPDA